MEEATLALVRFYQKFTFELSPGQVPLELGTGTTQGPKDGVFGKIHMRPKSSTEGVQESDTETYATM